MLKCLRRSGAIPAMMILILGACAEVAPAQDRPPTAPGLKPDQLKAIDRISADSLKGHLSYLASDLLEGRDTPSKGLDLAAEYIAAQFRRAGLEAVGDDGYFQTAAWDYAEPDPSAFRFDYAAGGEPVRVDPARVSLTWAKALDLRDAATVRISPRAADGPKPGEVEGKVVLVEYPDLRKAEASARLAARMTYNGLIGRMAAAKALAVVAVSDDPDAAVGLGAGRLIDPKGPDTPRPAPPLPFIIVHSPEVARAFAALPIGPTSATVTLKVGEPVRRPVKLRNVVGLLRGSDPALKDTYVMVTAHYDHIGVSGPAGTDRIHNGANDDGSGTVSVVELASALATLQERPKRSLLFVTFFGEEKGLLGSRYYGRNPVVPVEKTVADLNLEQLGRTDDVEGPRVASVSPTGFGYSDVTTILAAAGAAEGVQVIKHPRNSDAFFGRSDNQALADLGVPAHTLCVAFQYSDYHGAADHWDKVDYANMAKVDRMVGRALLAIADDPIEPKWDEANPRAARYLKAWKDRRGR